MALCRCINKHGWPGERNADFIGYVLPLGYPQTALICGHCDESGVIWLNEEEVSAYLNGQRIFEGSNNSARMKAGNHGVTLGRKK